MSGSSVISEQPKSKLNIDENNATENELKRLNATEDESNDNIPSNLKLLSATNKLIVNLSNSDIYVVVNDAEELIFSAKDIERGLFNLSNDFIFKDKNDQNVMRFKKPSNFNTATCCLSCCSTKLKVEFPGNDCIGKVHLTGFYCFPSLIIKNQNKDTLYEIEGPTVYCGGDYKFNVCKANTSELVAEISTDNTCCSRLFSSTPTQFEITFLKNLDVYHKILILGAGFYINGAFYDSTQFIPWFFMGS